MIVVADQNTSPSSYIPSSYIPSSYIPSIDLYPIHPPIPNPSTYTQSIHLYPTSLPLYYILHPSISYLYTSPSISSILLYPTSILHPLYPPSFYILQSSILHSPVVLYPTSILCPSISSIPLYPFLHTTKELTVKWMNMDMCTK